MSTNLHRRHLTTGQRAGAVGEVIEKTYKPVAEEKQRQATGGDMQPSNKTRQDKKT